MSTHFACLSAGELVSPRVNHVPAGPSSRPSLLRSKTGDFPWGKRSRSERPSWLTSRTSPPFQDAGSPGKPSMPENRINRSLRTAAGALPSGRYNTSTSLSSSRSAKTTPAIGPPELSGLGSVSLPLRYRRMVAAVEEYLDAAAIGCFAGECGQRTFRRVREAVDDEVEVTVLVEVAPAGGETDAAELVEPGPGRGIDELPGPGVSPESRAVGTGHD